ncbi:PKD domain-containing protein [Flavobacteriaceae bacterium]|nr:PKD domain-containing protein [Flavobacteriaceae bacterium]
MKRVKKIIVFTLMIFFSCENEVAIPVVADFSISVINNDFSVPVHIAITNTTEGADTFQWKFEGGIPAQSEKRNPGTIVFNQAGNYSIRLDAENRDGSTDAKEVQVPIDAEVQIGFTTQIVESNFPPMEVEISNTSLGAKTYTWAFENATPSSSTLEQPELVRFENPGTHQIYLEISNGLETYQASQTVTVAPHLAIDFTYQLAFEDNDREVPATLSLKSSATSVTDYNWYFSGANTAISTLENPQIIITDAGSQTLSLTASNGKESKTITKTINLLPNTNLQSFTDLQLGVNTAHNTNKKGAFFSAELQKVLSKNEVNESNGAAIDLVFFGLNSNFGFNKFISPQQAQTLTFDSIPNASATKFINRQESCSCTTSLTLNDFNQISDDTLLRNLTIEETEAGNQDFDLNILPRIVLFETEDGRKGAVKIKSFVLDGQNSYIVVDIKVMKESWQ